jgi:4-hydroxybenzoate polyprenyltransferase
MLSLICGVLLALALVTAPLAAAEVFSCGGIAAGVAWLYAKRKR